MTGIEVTSRVFKLGYFLTWLWPPKVSVDGGAPKNIGWNGTAVVPTSPGQHTVTVLWKYLWFIPSGKAQTTVTVPDGSVARLTYKPNYWVVFLSGKLETA